MTTKRSPSTPVSLKLDDEDRSRLSALATARKRSSHHLTREEARQSFRDEADKAWCDHEVNGLHATQVEIDAWVDSLGTRRPKRAPKWHN